MTSRKKPGVAFWVTVGLVVVLLYMASIGPAVSLRFHGHADWLPDGVIYRPIFIVATHHRQSNELLCRYIHLCGVSERDEPLMTESGIPVWISVGPTMRRD
jgi:hypothetical protein